MEWGNHAILGKLSRERRGMLFSWLDAHVIQRVIKTGGTLPNTKEEDKEPFSLLAIDAETIYTIADIPRTGEEEIFVVGKVPFSELPMARSKGRPPKYGEREAGQVCRMHNEGKSIRAIATELGMATATVQKILKKRQFSEARTAKPQRSFRGTK